MADLVSTQTRDSIFEIVLNRPDKRNAITWPMMIALGEAIDRAEKAAGLRAVIVRGEGTGFSAGIDLMAFAELDRSFGENWPARMLNVTNTFQAILNKFERCSLPTIAVLHGYALGLGFELALACDFRIAAEQTRLGLPEVRLGLIPDVGGTTRLTRLIGPSRAKEMIMTARSIDAEHAERWGLINASVAQAELQSMADALVSEIAQCAPLAVSYAKRVIDGMSDMDRGLQLEAWAQNHLVQTEDFQAGVQAMLSKSPPHWQGK